MKKAIVSAFVSLLFLLILFISQNQQFSDGKLHVVFCDVGQGDGIFIRTPKGMNVIVDGGPNDKILDCLSRHMPFWEKTIDLMLLSHPHADHFMGLASVMKRYTVLSFGSEKIDNKKAAGFLSLRQELERNRTPQRFVYAGDSFSSHDGVMFRIMGPSRAFLEATSPNGEIGESKEFGSVETLVSYGSFSVLLTGDSQASELREAITSGLLGPVTVLQVPHHGSKTGLDSEILDELYPQLAVISVGKNSYGHPTPEILKILGDKQIKILRTDKSGDIELVSDGKEWGVE